MLGVAAAVLLSVTGLVGGDRSAAAAAEDPRVVFTFTDPAITESSGLAVRDGLALTVNDSGDGPVVYAVDPNTGDTVGTTTYSDDIVADVEAITVGPDRALWVADIGDNNRDRHSIDLYRLPPGPLRGNHEVAATRYGLVYPDAPHDAETLLVHPRTGRVYVVTKDILGGVVYAAPASLRADRLNRLRQVGAVPGFLTDGTFLRDGDRVVLRGYASVGVYTFPGLTEVASGTLPLQEQGEGIAVSSGREVLISTEGEHSEVLAVRLPAPEARPEHPGPRPVATENDEGPGPRGWRAEDGALVWVGAAVLVLVFALRVYLRFFRRRSRRRW